MLTHTWVLMGEDLIFLLFTSNCTMLEEDIKKIQNEKIIEKIPSSYCVKQKRPWTKVQEMCDTTTRHHGVYSINK